MSLTLADISQRGRNMPDAEAAISREGGSRRAGKMSFYHTTGKRAFGPVTAGLLLFLTAPLLLVLLYLVSLEGGNPVFGHSRVGRDGRLFRCLKIRSVRPGAKAALAQILTRDPEAARERAESQKLTDDPRVTTFGRFLRKSSLDELPQRVNVLRGEMSVVGPRPITADELARYGVQTEDYLALKPGLTGQWQVGDRNDISYDKCVALDANYGRSMGFVTDLTIALKTAFSVLKVSRVPDCALSGRSRGPIELDPSDT